METRTDNLTIPNMRLTIPTTERGSATIIVVGTIAVLTVMLMHITVASGILAREAHVSSARAELRYDAESAINHALWMYLSDRVKHPSRSIQTSALVEEALNEEEERWRADGIPHDVRLDNTNVRVILLDANRGLDIATGNPSRAFRELVTAEEAQDPAIAEMMDLLSDQLDDYVDAGDDFRRLNGMERDEYEAEGWPDLPRDFPFQFREEVLWIFAAPMTLQMLGISTALEAVQSLRIVPPRGSSFPANNRPSFFAAAQALFTAKLDLTDTDIEDILDARRRWQEGDTGAIEALPTELTAALRGGFSFAESGVLTVAATASLPNAEVRRTMQLTRDCRSLPPANRDVPFWENWEKVVDPNPLD